MSSVRLCVCLPLLLLLLRCAHSQKGGAVPSDLDEDPQREVLLNALLRRARTQRPVSAVPKRAQQGSRFALSLDVPTSILSVLIDLAKNQDLRTKAAANAQLMARIGKRK